VIDNRINALSSSYVGESRATLSAESPGSTAAPVKLLPFASVLTKTDVRFGVSQSPTVGTDFWVIAGSTTLCTAGCVAQLAFALAARLCKQLALCFKKHTWLHGPRSLRGS